jgi:tetratricopeptide (TPR) repeat protein
LGGYFLDIQNYEKAISTIEPVLKDSNLIAENKVEAYRILSQSYAKLKSFTKAYEYQQNYIELKDSLANEENTKK